MIQASDSSVAREDKPVGRSQLHQAVEEFLIREAELIDGERFEEWNQLFTEDGVYWIPIDPDKPHESEWSIIYDTPLRREERVYHLANVPFPSQRPRSRTLHLITNLRTRDDGTDGVLAVTNQLICEMRLGDWRQTGLGQQRTLAARVEHRLVLESGRFRIALKAVHLLNAGGPVANLTFIL